MHPHFFRPSFLGIIVFWGLLSCWVNQGSSQENLVPSFFVSQTTLFTGRTQVVPIQLSQPTSVDIQLQATTETPEYIEILKPPYILAGERIGYLRIRAKKAGQTTLYLQSPQESPPARLQVHIQEVAFNPEATLQRPTLFGVVPGAFLWGKVALGAEIFQDPIRSPNDSATLELQLSTGETFAPVSQQRFHQEPFLYAFFEIDTKTLSEGPCQLTAQMNDNGYLRESLPIPVRIVHPPQENVILGECEDHQQSPRPKAYGTNYPKLGSSPEASQGTFVLNYGANPACCVSVNIPATGTYQVALVARGDFAAGAFPTVGVVLNESPRASISGQLVHNRWHRVILGRPFSLEAGPQILTLLFQNDFYVQALSDRNLYLDRYELLRVEDQASQNTSTMDSGMMMESSMNSMNSMDSMNSMNSNAYGSTFKNLKITLNRPIDGKPVTGALTLNATCTWDGQDKTPEPLVTLWINYRPISSQQSGEPLFWIDRSLLKPHENTLFLQATFPSGEVALTPVQRVYCDEKSTSKISPLSFHRFTAIDGRWDEASRSLLTQQGRVKMMLFSTNGQATFQLPEKIEGTFDIYLDGQGSNLKGWAETQLTITSVEKEIALKPVAITNGFTPRKIERVQFLPETGKKSITVAFKNDLYEKDVGDRNLWVRSLILQQVSTEPDTQPPQVTLQYPPHEHSVYGGDMVVVNASDNDAINYADVVIDQKIQIMNLQVAGGAGRFFFPLLARDLAPGAHQLLVRVWDRAGNIGESQEITFHVLPSPPAQRTVYARAVHLTKRFGYGPEYAELADILTLGETAWLEERLSRPLKTGGDLSALEQAIQTYPNDENAGHIIHRVLRHLLLTDNPVRFRLVLWVQNHFSTWMQKTSTWSKWDEFSRFLEAGAVPFGDLLFLSATSPAMLVYLDQNRSYAYQLNENYAREIMELHTLGVHGGYTQKDVTSLAGLLNGWTFSDQGYATGIGYPLTRKFRFEPMFNAGEARTVFGLRFDASAPEYRHDQIRFALEMLAAHPSTARFICRKLIHHYVSVPANEALVEELAQQFMQNGGDLKKMLIALSQHAEFWNNDLPKRLTTPLDFTTSILRVCENLSNAWVSDCMAKSGVALFDCATPDGYPEENEAYANSNAMIQRWRFAKLAGGPLQGVLPPPWRAVPRQDKSLWYQKVVDVFALRITGALLNETANQAALETIAASKEEGNRILIDLATFICQLPEANFR